MFSLLRNIWVICLVNLWFIDLSAQALEPALVFTTQNGLPQIQTTTMMQDSRGYIWAGTKRGMASYNGSSWNKIKTDTEYEFEMLREIADGNILAIVKQGGLGPYYIYDGNEMKPSEISLYDPARFNCRVIKDTLYHLNLLDSKIYKIDLSSDKLLEEYEIDISQFRLAGYSQDYGLILRQKGEGQDFDLVSLKDLKVLKQMHLDDFNPIAEKVGAEIFVNFENDYYEFYKYDNFKFLGKVKYKDGSLWDAQFDAVETVYFLDAEHNYRFNPSTNRIEKLKQINTTRNIFLEDKDGNLWNSSESGIQLFPKNNFVDYTGNELSDAWFFQPYNGDYIYGNFTAGLKHVQLDPYSVNSITSNKRNRIYFGPSIMDGKLYIPGSSYISVLDGRSLDHIDVRKYNTPLLTSFYDKVTEAVYFGGLKSLMKLSKDEEIDFYQDKEDVFSRYVLTITRFDDENLIFGTKSDLCLLNLKSSSYKSLTDLFPTVQEAGATSIQKDDRGNLWIGNNAGLWHFDIDNHSLTKIGENIFDDYVMSILQVKKNLLAFGTSKNLMYLKLNEFYNSGKTIIKTFNYKNGFHGEEVGQNGLILQDSILWIPSATRLISTNVNSIEFTPTFANVCINSLNQKALSFGFIEDEVIDLTFGTNDIEIEYEAIGINQPANNTFQYKLVGLENSWSQWTSDTKASFSDLSSGEYEFVVRTRSSSNLGTAYPEKKIMFRLDMPFYNEPNFHKNALFLTLFLLGLIAILLYTLYNRRKAKLDLDKQFKLLQVQTLQLQLNPHFLFNVLGTIQSLILEKDMENANKYLVSFSKMIRRYLDYNVSAYKSLESNSTDTIKISLHEEFDILKIYLEFEKLQLGDKFDYQITIEDDIDALEIQIPPLIIQPLIENCIKHGVVPKKGKSFIQITATRKDKGVLIHIKDDGIGISRSLELQKSSMKEFKSLSLQLINERIKVLNSMGENISLDVRDLQNQGGVEQLIFVDQTHSED